MNKKPPIMSELTILSKRIHDNAEKNGFHSPPRRLPELLTLAHSELSEAFEEWRDDPERPTVFGKSGPQGWAVEIVDCIIVCLDILYSSGIAVEPLLIEKITYNETRPRRHGRGI